MMSTEDLLSVDPQGLQFPFELKKQISCSLQLKNNTENFVAFKVKTTNPKKYCVRPNTGVVLPHSTCDVIVWGGTMISGWEPDSTDLAEVTMQAQREAPPDMQCKDKFLLQSVVASPGAPAKDITSEMFNRGTGNKVEESKLRVAYVSPPQPPSPVREGSEEGSSPRGSVSENGTMSATEYTTASRAHVDMAQAEPPDYSPDVKTIISKLTEEKNSELQQHKKLQQELELLRREGSKTRGGIPTLYVVIVAVLGIVVGYLLKRT